jgi:hypothetical protein
MPIYDERQDIFWPDFGEEDLPPWEFRVPECLARPDRWWLGETT